MSCIARTARFALLRCAVCAFDSAFALQEAARIVLLRDIAHCLLAVLLLTTQTLDVGYCGTLHSTAQHRAAHHHLTDTDTAQSLAAQKQHTAAPGLTRPDLGWPPCCPLPTPA